MLGIPWNVLAAVGGGILLAVWQFWPGISSLWGRLPKIGTTASPSTDRLKAVEATDYLLNYFKDCPEGKAAARVCWQHLADDHTETPA